MIVYRTYSLILESNYSGDVVEEKYKWSTLNCIQGRSLCLSLSVSHTHPHTHGWAETRRRCGPVSEPCHVKRRAGRRKMRGVKGRKQLVESPEDINLRGGETGWQERPSNKAWYYCCKGVCVVCVCLSSWGITGEAGKVCLFGVCAKVCVHLTATNLFPLFITNISELYSQRSCLVVSCEHNLQISLSLSALPSHTHTKHLKKKKN